MFIPHPVSDDRQNGGDTWELHLNDDDDDDDNDNNTSNLSRHVCRVSARSTSGTSRKTSSAQPSTGRAGSVPSSIQIPEEPPLPKAIPSLRRDVCSIFTDAQRSTTGHRKLVVRLRKLQEACSRISQKSSKKDSKKVQEQVSLPTEESLPETEFNVEIGRCVLPIVPIKKSEPVGDRILRFLGTFLSHASEKDAELFASDDDENTPETPTSRLTTRLVALLVPLLPAKDRTVRFCATQIIANIINSLDTVDDDLYHTLRQGLLKRIRDKEPSVRVQALMGLARLAGNDEDDDNDDSSALVEKLVDIMQNDTSADVRKTLLLNLLTSYPPLSPGTCEGFGRRYTTSSVCSIASDSRQFPPSLSFDERKVAQMGLT